MSPWDVVGILSTTTLCLFGIFFISDKVTEWVISEFERRQRINEYLEKLAKERDSNGGS